MVELGYNYRLSDIHCALGLSQLEKLERFIGERQVIASSYFRDLMEVPGIEPIGELSDRMHGYHLFVVKVAGDRDAWLQVLRSRGIGVNVHYLPVYWHPYYRDRFGDLTGTCPVAERVYSEILSLPIYPALVGEAYAQVLTVLAEVAAG